jgi:hypothetical protein
LGDIECAAGRLRDSWLRTLHRQLELLGFAFSLALQTEGDGNTGKVEAAIGLMAHPQGGLLQQSVHVVNRGFSQSARQDWAASQTTRLPTKRFQSIPAMVVNSPFVGQHAEFMLFGRLHRTIFSRPLRTALQIRGLNPVGFMSPRMRSR